MNAESSNHFIAGLENIRTKRYATQFHPEVAHTAKGQEILHNFLFKIAKCEPSWTPDNFIDEKVDADRRERVVVLCDQLGPIWIVPLRIDERVRLTRVTKRILRLRVTELRS